MILSVELDFQAPDPRSKPPISANERTGSFTTAAGFRISRPNPETLRIDHDEAKTSLVLPWARVRYALWEEPPAPETAKPAAPTPPAPKAKR